VIQTIDDANVGGAIDLLTEGFPDRSAAYWEDALERVRMFGGNTAANLPIGYLLTSANGPAGVALTLASTRPQGHTVVNFAAWYIKPEHRLRAPVMLRAIAGMGCDVITDLTPAPSVQRMLPAFKFAPFTAGIALNPLPLAALQIDGAHVLPLEAAEPTDMPADLAAFLSAHRPFGCIPAVLRAGDGITPLMFKMGRWRRLKAAHLLYCGSNAHLMRHIGAVARFLLARGALILRLDIPLAGRVRGVRRPGQNIKFARGITDPDVTDYAASELALFEI
jgi:hypothetical protein